MRRTRSTTTRRPDRAGRRALLAALAASPFALAASWPLERDPAHQARPTGSIALARGRELVIVQADGSGERTLLSVEPSVFVTDPVWSPDGGRIVFSRYTLGGTDPLGGADLYWVATSGSPEPAVLARRDQSGALLAAPAWAPDGSGVAFENVGMPGPSGTTARVEWIGADGTGRRTLVDDARNPAISPDGSQIAFVRSTSRGDGLWTRGLADGEPTLVVADGELMAIAFPRFSPDGRTLAFAGIGAVDERGPAMRLEGWGAPIDPRAGWRVRHAARHGIPWDLFVVEPGRARLRRLADVKADDATVAWSPDGRWIAIAGSTGIQLVSFPEGDVRALSAEGSFGAIDWR